LAKYEPNVVPILLQVGRWAEFSAMRLAARAVVVTGILGAVMKAMNK
jgi:hypothetical protein